jgi:redox-sensitive bicupin YhaK (pirin superfamily)
MNPDPDVPVRLIQMWVRPDTVGVRPGYEQVDVTDRLAAGGLVAVASGDPDVDSAIRIRQREATMWVARLGADEAVELPAAPHAHVFVATGSVLVDGVDGPVGRGDALRLTAEGPLVARAIESGTELIVWATA